MKKQQIPTFFRFNPLESCFFAISMLTISGKRCFPLVINQLSKDNRLWQLQKRLLQKRLLPQRKLLLLLRKLLPPKRLRLLPRKLLLLLRRLLPPKKLLPQRRQLLPRSALSTPHS